MNQVITIGGLLLGMGAFVSFVMVAIGALALFAGGMSDNQGAGDGASRTGCIALIGGGVLFAMFVWGLLS